MQTPKWVAQEHSRGCGVACIAMITGKTYAEAHEHFPDVDDNKGLRSSDYRLIDAYLAKCGYAVARIYKQGKPDDWCPEPITHVHMVEVMNGKSGHFVVMLGDGTVLDPLTADTKRLCDYAAVCNIVAVVPISKEYAGD